MDTLLSKSTTDLITLLVAILIFIVVLVFIIFLLMKVFKINIKLKDIGFFSNSNKVKENLVNQVSAIGYQYMDELQDIIKEKYLLKCIDERHRQLNYCERIWKIVFSQIRNGFMILRNQDDIVADHNTQHFDLSIESTNHLVTIYFRNIFQENGIDKLNNITEGTKESELNEYIKAHQYTLKETIFKHMEKKCLFIQTPSCGKLIKYIRDNFSDEIDQAVEKCILKAREICINIKKEVAQKNNEIKDLLTHNIKNTLKEKMEHIDEKK